MLSDCCCTIVSPNQRNFQERRGFGLAPTKQTSGRWSICSRQPRRAKLIRNVNDDHSPPRQQQNERCTNQPSNTLWHCQQREKLPKGAGRGEPMGLSGGRTHGWWPRRRGKGALASSNAELLSLAILSLATPIQSRKPKCRQLGFALGTSLMYLFPWSTKETRY